MYVSVLCLFWDFGSTSLCICEVQLVFTMECVLVYEDLGYFSPLQNLHLGNVLIIQFSKKVSTALKRNQDNPNGHLQVCVGNSTEIIPPLYHSLDSHLQEYRKTYLRNSDHKCLVLILCVRSNTLIRLSVVFIYAWYNYSPQ